MTADRVMLLIDADNVSADIIEQAVVLLLAEHGALHVRRAYCTAESAVQNQALFKRLQIKPMVNLAAGKNSTDIALAVDAVDLVLAERPELVVIASSDSDFAPLVGRLREKGCRVEGIGQLGKIGDETQTVYDAYTVLTHKARSAARQPAPRAAQRMAPQRAQPAAQQAEQQAPQQPAPQTAPAKTARAPAKKVTRRKAEPSLSASPPALEAADKLQQILQTLPELARGEAVDLQMAGERLRKARLLSRSGSSKKLLSQFADRFELLPAGQPTRVVLR